MRMRYVCLDCNYLAHRAKHVFGKLSYGGSATGVIYGFLRDILSMRERFFPATFVFCWDSRNKDLRRAIVPEYKQKRNKEKKTAAEVKFDNEFFQQIDKLRDEYLKTIGYRNVLFQEGFESDDLIAAVCKTVDVQDTVYIVSADHDLWQLIDKNVYWYNPRNSSLISSGGFEKLYGIKPKMWAAVKAIAGCSSDNVPGVPGIGEKTALLYLTKKLDVSSKKYAAIREGWKDIVLRNRKVVELPMTGVMTPKLVVDNPTQEGWNKVTKMLGMKSIRYVSGGGTLYD